MQTTAPDPDPTLDEALDRIRELSGRLWDVRRAHAPVVTGRWHRTVVCRVCGGPAPCPTRLATGG